MRVSTVILCIALAVGLVPAAAHARSKAPVEPYHGLATWVDIYDAKPWRRPERTIDRLRAKGVRTLYLQTSNWQTRSGLKRPASIGRFLDAARAKDIKVVAWYVPSFEEPSIDLKRSLKAIRFRTRKGGRFDSFAMDIEAVNVRNIYKRNARLMRLSRGVRAEVGADYPLGAIIPDPKTQRYWPRFPYRGVAQLYDVFLPMSYFTFRTKGYDNVYKYTRASLKIIRRRTGRRDVPIHVIGGLAGDASRGEVKAFTKGVREHGAVGASLYDLPLMTPRDWGIMTKIDRDPRRRPKERPAPEVAPRFARHGSSSARSISRLYL